MRLLDRFQQPDPIITCELRPPRADLERAASIETWMGMASAVRRLVQQDTAVYLTDNAVGTNEEENLRHLMTNVEEDVALDRICPFLTTKHTLEYCLWYADRAVQKGYAALTVLGGDAKVGPARCLPHACDLRQQIRKRHPTLALGGWANPGRDADQQVDYLLDDGFVADFYLTQIVSHYDLDPVRRFWDAAQRRDLPHPGVFGVFYYRSANAKTLKFLANFLPVPIEQLTRDFGAGMSAEEICATTIRELRTLGIARVYISNLSYENAPEKLKTIRELVG
jgi:hypothetical protein